MSSRKKCVSKLHYEFPLGISKDSCRNKSSIASRYRLDSLLGNKVIEDIASCKRVTVVLSFQIVVGPIVSLSVTAKSFPSE